MITILSLFTLILFPWNSDQKQEVDVSFDNLKEIQVEGKFCKVEIIGKNQSKVHLQAYLEDSRGKYEIRYQVSGSRLEVWLDSKRSFSGNVRGEIKLVVPVETDVMVDNGSGSIYAENLKYGALVLENGSGSIKVNDIITNGRLRTSSGSIEVNGFNGDLEVESSSGSQRLYNITGDIKTISSSGSIKYENIRGNIEGQSSSGSQNLNRINGALSLKSSSGSINGSSIELTNHSHFASSSGSINFNLINDVNDLGFDLRSSSGSLRAGTMKSQKRLKVQRSGIHIEGISTSGSQNYRN